MKKAPLNNLESFTNAQAILWDDLGRTRIALQNDTGSQYHRRQLLREFVSFVEAVVFYQKQVILTIREQIAFILIEDHPSKKFLKEYFDINLNHHESAILREESLDVTETGGVKTSPKYIRSTRNIRFTQRCYLSTIKTGYKIDYTHHGWAALQRVISRRNRLTHPKLEDDMMISDTDVNDIIQANDWYGDISKGMLGAASERLESFAAILEKK